MPRKPSSQTLERETIVISDSSDAEQQPAVEMKGKYTAKDLEELEIDEEGKETDEGGTGGDLRRIAEGVEHCATGLRSLGHQMDETTLLSKAHFSHMLYVLKQLKGMNQSLKRSADAAEGREPFEEVETPELSRVRVRVRVI
jgi:hypothetical protein